MTKREAMRINHQEAALLSLGFTPTEAEQLRRISNTLQRWYELECGTGEGQVSRSIERDGPDGDGKPFMRIQYPTPHGYHDSRYPVADRERGAIKRLDTILAACNARRGYTDALTLPLLPLQAYRQTDPRGACLYILRPGDVPAGADVRGYYSRGICVY